MQTRRADRQQQQQETASPMSVVTPSVAQAPKSRVDRDRRERERERERDPIVTSSDDAAAHTPRSRPAHPAAAAARQPTPPASLARSRAPPMSPNATGGSSASSTRSAGSAAAGNGNGSGTSAAAEKKKTNDKWVESVDYAYEYVPVAQKREGRKNISYELLMRQQPLQARMCGVGEKSDRRPVDPTPIIQLKVMTSDGEDVTPLDPRHEKGQRRQSPGAGNVLFMQNPYYFLFACLVGGDDQDAELHVIDDGRTRFLTGTPVSSLYHLKDIDNKDAAFFVFPDLGVRKEGRYKLKLTLFEIVDQEVYYCTTLLTETFSVYSAKKFPGMSKATALSRAFADQGLKIRVRKDPRPARTKDKERKRKNSAASEEEDVYGKRQRHATHPGYPVETRGYAPEGHYATYPPPPNGYAYTPGYQHQQMPPPPPPPAFEGYRPGSAGAPSPHHGHHPNMPPQGPYSPPYYAPSYGYQRPRHTLPPNYPSDPYYQSGPPPPNAGPYDPRWDMRGGDPRDLREIREREMREREMHEHEMREREMREREIGRDPREMQMRDPRDDPRYARDPRDYPQRPPSPPREYDPRDMYPRDPRDMDPRYARDPREPPRDPREMRDDPRDPRGFYNREPRGSPLYHTPPRSAGAVLSPASVLPGDRDHRPTTAPARGPPGPPPMRLPPLGSRVDAPPSLGAYPRERERRDDLSRPGSGWSGSGSGSRGHTHPGDRSPDTPGGSTKPTGRMGVGHLVD